MQHKIIFAVAILVVLVIIALLIFAIVKIKQSADGQQQQWAHTKADTYAGRDLTLLYVNLLFDSCAIPSQVSS